MNWTKEEMNLLREWRDRKIPIYTIAERLNRSIGSVDAKIRRLQLPRAGKTTLPVLPCLKN